MIKTKEDAFYVDCHSFKIVKMILGELEVYEEKKKRKMTENKSKNTKKKEHQP